MDLSKHRIKLDRIFKATKCIDPVFLHSPQFNCEPLSTLLGTELYLKIETMNPIRSFKGRGADFLLHEARIRDEIVCASAGNFGQAMAYACRKGRVPLTVFAAETANQLKIDRMRALGATVVLYGSDFDSAKEQARLHASKNSLRFVEDGLDVETAEGAGTIGLELLQIRDLKAVLIPVGNGALFNGIARVFKELKPDVQMVAVQASGAPAMIESLQTGEVKVHKEVTTIADGIGVRIPVPQALEDMRPLVDHMLLVGEEEILDAMRSVLIHVGLVAEPSAVVGLAAIKKYNKWTGGKVATIICGGNLTESQVKKWLI